jgi:transposase-like protein
MTKFPEVISALQRRLDLSTEDKVAILDAAFRKGGSIAAAADRFGVSRGLIYICRSPCEVERRCADSAAFMVSTEDASQPHLRSCLLMRWLLRTSKRTNGATPWAFGVHGNNGRSNRQLTSLIRYYFIQIRDADTVCYLLRRQGN